MIHAILVPTNTSINLCPACTSLPFTSIYTHKLIQTSIRLAPTILLHHHYQLLVFSSVVNIKVKKEKKNLNLWVALIQTWRSLSSSSL